MTISDDTNTSARVAAPAPFWVSLGLVPVAMLAAIYGGWALLLLPLSTWYLFTGLDFLVGLDCENPAVDAPDGTLFWHQAITLIWVPVQLVTVFGIMRYLTTTDHLHLVEQWALFAGLGILSGTIGITYAHELMHQRPKIERWAADILLASVLYSHFRSEHLLVHHRHVGTPRDAVTARYGEGFYRFFARVLRECGVSAFRAEAAMLARKRKPWTDWSNPFWRYWALQGGFIVLAYLIAGWWGVFLFATQAFWAVFQLELVNYVEHYGLTRKYLGEGKYEHVKPRHSWNAAYRASNWLLINLQRHSDHHYKPDRRYPLLQTYGEDEAPQLPFGYPVMTMLALSPSLWRKVMNPRVVAWRTRYYPEITDWQKRPAAAQVP
ncbi:alkane 1-monooxygenase [Yoonia sediminilitoris]|uniref:Alkane 1-monooxygenase n=1 Tax=Yoonia sediminilitoris TaxID=1286148 RepID=A0A2T6KA15_9RHOB|nr:alkane 1-monooxygenase [Yoonia sediminilitoris]PUB11583.1 alkane 1-monooxygenase [Yoonia sediminilitoris]RCW91783.1 alkane 1-monooxygenase [Yoonia sediminilitoris]